MPSGACVRLMRQRIMLVFWPRHHEATLKPLTLIVASKLSLKTAPWQLFRRHRGHCPEAADESHSGHRRRWSWDERLLVRDMGAEIYKRNGG